jgi:nucleoside-diphosphate-sugar epimerase
MFVAKTAQVVEQWSQSTSCRLVAFSSTSALTKSNSSEPSDREISALLSEGEARLRELHPSVTILRPTMIYGGPGDRNVERVAQQLLKFPFFPLVGSGMGLRQPVHADDLATAAVLSAKSSLASGKTYNLAGSGVLPFRQMIQRIGAANNSAVRFVSIPLPAARTALRLLSPFPRFRGIPLGSLERMSQDLVFDISEARQDFGYAPRPFEPPTY